jgi:hypothetical protein
MATNSVSEEGLTRLVGVVGKQVDVELLELDCYVVADKFIEDAPHRYYKKIGTLGKFIELEDITGQPRPLYIFDDYDSQIQCEEFYQQDLVGWLDNKVPEVEI